MGEEIKSSHFSSKDFARFRQRPDSETEQFCELYRQGEFSEEDPVAVDSRLHKTSNRHHRQ